MVIVDEASMIDISLMAKLLAALSPRTRLILLGDSQQLASVESGAVLANLCRDQMMFDSDFVAMAESVAGINLDETVISSSQAILVNSVVQLQHSYRFDQHSLIGRLARSVQSGDKAAVVDELHQVDSSVWQQPNTENVLKAVVEGYHNYFEAIASKSDPQTCIQAYEQFRVLCALKLGPQSVASVNAAIEKHLNRKGWRSYTDFYHGRPIMVVQNDYRQQLFNGDIGLVLRDEEGDLQVYFLFDNTLRTVPITRLPAHETAYAMTVHKSQGSEFDNVCVVLPEEDSAVLTRELFYTAITRAKKQVMVMATEDIVRSSVVRMHQRETGLADELNRA